MVRFGFGIHAYTQGLLGTHEFELGMGSEMNAMNALRMPFGQRRGKLTHSSPE